MDKAMDKYFEFLVNTMISDAELFTRWWMWFMVPAMFYFVFLMFKFILFLIPVWFPLLIITLPFRKPNIYYTNSTNNSKPE